MIRSLIHIALLYEQHCSNSSSPVDTKLISHQPQQWPGGLESALSSIFGRSVVTTANYPIKSNLTSRSFILTLLHREYADCLLHYAFLVKLCGCMEQVSRILIRNADDAQANTRSRCSESEIETIMTQCRVAAHSMRLVSSLSCDGLYVQMHPSNHDGLFRPNNKFHLQAF